MNEVSFTVPLVPPGVNHYVKHTRGGRHYVTKEAIAYKRAVAIFAAGQWLESDQFEVKLHVYLGKGQRGDVDGFEKVVLDGLADAGVFRDRKGKRVSDAKVKRTFPEKFRDRENPRTEITVRAL